MKPADPLGDALAACRETLPEFAGIDSDADNELLGALASGAEARLAEDRAQVERELQGLNDMIRRYRDVIQTMERDILTENRIHSEAAEHFRVAQALLRRLARGALEYLGEAGMRRLLALRSDIDKSWNTPQMNSLMEQLLRTAPRQLEQAVEKLRPAEELVARTYQRFRTEFGFESRTPPDCTLDRARELLVEHVEKTVQSLASPAGVIRDKRVVVDKFFDGPIAGLHPILADAARRVRSWIGEALTPLLLQLQERRSEIDAKTDNIAKIEENIVTLETRIGELGARQAALGRDVELLTALRRQLPGTAD